MLDAYRDGSFFDVLASYVEAEAEADPYQLEPAERFVLALIEGIRDGSGRDVA